MATEQSFLEFRFSLTAPELPLRSVSAVLHVRTTRISTHRYQRSYRTRSTSLTNNWWKSCNNNCRNSSFFNRSLHQYCRAVAGTSASGEDYCVNILIFEHFSDSRTSFMFEFLLVSTTTHESSMYRSTSSDKSFCS